jgi:hypothetical protein
MDLQTENHGSICLLRPVTKAGKAWIKETAPEGAQFFGNALVVEPRFVEDVLAVAAADGLNIAGRCV